VLLEVKTKPGATPTKFQICFEGTPSYACTDQSPTYTAPGTYQWTTPFSNFYFGGDVDWSKGINKVALILKDTNNNKPQGDPKYVPTDLHVEVAIVSPGASYVPPAPRDAGVAFDAGTGSDAGAPRLDAGSGGPARPIADAGRDQDAGSTALDAAIRDAGTAAVDGSSRPPDEGEDGDAGTDGGSAMSGGSEGTDAGDAEDAGSDKKSDGCSVAPGAETGAGGLWLAFAAGLLLTLRRRGSARALRSHRRV
jgi:MYXO-CTERM domain-containing protein